MIEAIRIPIKQSCNGFYIRWYYNGWHYWSFLPGAIGYATRGEKYRTYGTRSIDLSSGQLTYQQVNAIRSILNSTDIWLYTDGGWAPIRIEAGAVTVSNNRIDAYELTFTAFLSSRKISATGYSPVIILPVAPQPEYCELVIGTQTWMCANWDANYPGSKVYDNDEDNRALYGGLYTIGQVMSPGFCPEGWHVPTEAEWQTLIDYLGGTTYAGGRLKEAGTTYWKTPNTGADDAAGFKARGGGYCTYGTNFLELKESGMYWTATGSKFVMMEYDRANIVINTGAYYDYLSLRLIKDSDSHFKSTDSLFSFHWTGVILGDKLLSNLDGRAITIVGKDFTTGYIPATSAATFRLDDDVDFITDDEDNLWFTGASQNDVTVADMIGANYTRTLIKYSDTAPYDITEIAILKSGVTPTAEEMALLYETFHLSIFWSGVLSGQGYIKGNRIQ
jgi:uncharacterized protein (TIGR02145 family)